MILLVPQFAVMLFRRARWLAVAVPSLSFAAVTGSSAITTPPPVKLAPVLWWAKACETAGIPAKSDAPITQRQLATIALEAVKEMEIKLRGVPGSEDGAGAAIRALLPAWKKQATSATGRATVAQVREIARPFRERLVAVGYKNFPADNARKLDDSGKDAAPVKEDTSVTVAKLHDLFFFDLDNFDSDGDGKTYAEEIVAGTDPFDWFNGEPHTITIIEGDNQVGPPGYFLPYPLTVKIQNAVGHFYVGAPTTFSFTDDEPGFFSATGDNASPLLRSITVRTDEHGLAWAYIFQPKDESPAKPSTGGLPTDPKQVGVPPKATTATTFTTSAATGAKPSVKN
jgi:hypothetical protein